MRDKSIDSFGDFVKLIGSLMVSAIIFTIPILCTLSFVLHWDAVITFLTAVFSVLIFVGLTLAIFTAAEDI